MPVLRTIKTYRHRGTKRFVRLYRAWWNMKSRCAGHIRSGTDEPIWQGLDISVEWLQFENFRAWALANGYSRLRCSLDRERTAEGYGPDNCRWLTVRQNSMRALYGDDPWEMGGRTMYVAAGKDCPF